MKNKNLFILLRCTFKRMCGGVETVFPEDENSKLFSNLWVKIIKRSKTEQRLLQWHNKSFFGVSMETTIMHKIFYADIVDVPPLYMISIKCFFGAREKARSSCVIKINPLEQFCWVIFWCLQGVERDFNGSELLLLLNLKRLFFNTSTSLTEVETNSVILQG